MTALIVKVYQPNGVTLISELYHRMGVNCQDPLNATGVGSVTIALPHEQLAAQPGLFNWRNIVKFFLGNKCIYGFRIQNRQTTYVSTDEWKGFVKIFSGPSVRNLLEDFMVVHDGRVRPDSLDSRSYSWASMRDEWYNAADWNDPILSRPWTDPPGDWNKPLKKRSKYHQPKGWPDKTALWIWPTKTSHGRNTARYFRKNFTLRSAVHVRVFATADERLRVYMDGEEIISADGVETGYTEKNSVDLVIGPGTHTIAAYTEGIWTAKGDANDSLLLSMMRVNSRGKARGVILHSDESWEAHYGNPAPGWNRAQVLRNCVNEAKARGNDSALALTLDFTESRDSAGLKWYDRWNDEVSIGTSAQSLATTLSEGGGFDVSVDPGTMKLQAWRRQGRNKSSSITLEPGRNLLSWDVTEIDDVKNTFLLNFNGGWTHYTDIASVKTYGDREAFVSLGNLNHAGDAVNLMKQVARGVGSAIQQAGTSDLRTVKQDQPAGGLIGVEGAMPFLDFVTGDTVKAPNANGFLVPHRVMSLTLTEDENSYISYDEEMEEVR